jgi:type I restriction enzyme M protein
MRNDAGINGDAQRIEQMVWILFLKVYNAKEENWELFDEKYTSVIPKQFHWSEWAVDKKDGKALTGEALLNFINNELFPALKNLEIDETTPMSKIVVQNAFEDNNNYMKDGILLRQVVNIIDELDFGEYEDRHAFGEIYETILRSLQSAGNAGEFYTPRAVTDFMTQMVAPKLGEKIADFACGTGGFLTSALKMIDTQVKTVEDKEIYNNSIYGIEKKALPHLLCVTNMLLRDIDNPVIIHGNS